MGLHKSLAYGDIHIVHSYEYANAAARTGATGFVSADIGRCALQTDDGTLWFLKATTPTWTQLTNDTSAGETNTASNVGSGVGVWKDKSGVDLRFKSLVASTGIALTSNTNDVTITGSDQRDNVVWDHFITGTNVTERIGLMGWLLGVSGTGATFTIDGDTGRPGIIACNGGTVAAGRCGIWIGDSSFPVFTLGSVQPQLDLEVLIAFNANALNTSHMERFTVGWGDGWNNAAGADHTNQITCEFTPGSDAHFRLVTEAASTYTRTATTQTVAGSNTFGSVTWYRIGLNITYPSNVPTAKLLVNGTVLATNTANFPTADMGIGIRIDANAGGSAPITYCDYYKITQATTKET